MFVIMCMVLLIGGVIGGVIFFFFVQEIIKNDIVIVILFVQSGVIKLVMLDIEMLQLVFIIICQQFEEQGVISVCQVVSYISGVYSNQIGVFNCFDYIVLCGFLDGSLDNVYFDGLKMMGDINLYSLLVVDFWFLEDIEVVCGLVFVLYGCLLSGGIVLLML